jgi:potassium/hydrogen antiporter
LLHVAVPAKAKRRMGFDFELSDNIKSEMKQLQLAPTASAVGKKIVELSIPATVNILAVNRGDVFITPTGSTRLMANDVLHVVAEDRQQLELLAKALDVTLPAQ